MFSFLNSLFTESGFYEIVNNAIDKLIKDGPYTFDFPFKGGEHYGYLSNTGGDQSNDPNYEEYKNSKLIVYDDKKRTVDEVLGEKMFEWHLSEILKIEINRDFKIFQKYITDPKLDKKEVSSIATKAKNEIAYFKKEFSAMEKLKDRSYILEGLNEIELWINNKYKSYLNPVVENDLVIKWKGSIADLSSLFYYTSKERNDQSKLEFYFNEDRAKLAEFISRYFVDEKGERITKETVYRNLNPDRQDTKKNVKKHINDFTKSRRDTPL